MRMDINHTFIIQYEVKLIGFMMAGVGGVGGDSLVGNITTGKVSELPSKNGLQTVTIYYCHNTNALWVAEGDISRLPQHINASYATP